MLPAEPYVQSFGYRENPEYILYLEESKLAFEKESDDTLITGASPTENESLSEAVEYPIQGEEREPLVPPLPFILDVHFDPSIIKNKMKSLGIPVWGSVRPSVLVWMVTEDLGERAIIGTSDESPFVQLLAQHSLERGVPTFLPVADLEDISNIDTDELWGLFPESVSSASDRYSADARVLFRISNTEEDFWSGNWVLQIKGENYHGSVYDVSRGIVLSSLISSIAHTLSLKYAINTTIDTSANYLNVEVGNISNFEDYVSVQNYLRDLSPVSEFSMTRVIGDSIEFKLILVVGQEKFFEHLELGGKLSRAVEALEPDVDELRPGLTEKLVWVREQ